MAKPDLGQVIYFSVIPLIMIIFLWSQVIQMKSVKMIQSSVWMLSKVVKVESLDITFHSIGINNINYMKPSNRFDSRELGGPITFLNAAPYKKAFVKIEMTLS